MSRSEKLLLMQLPVLLNEIVLKLSMRARVFNLPLRLKKCLDTIWISYWLNNTTNIVVEESQV
jgi:hypothetical protein